MDFQLIPNTETVFAAPYFRRFFKGTVSAITVWDADHNEYVTINVPEAVFYSSNGERMTVKGLRGTGTSRTFSDSNSGVVSVYFTNGTSMHNDTHLDNF